jgi:hypothetical protein
MRSGCYPPEKTFPFEFRICCLLVILVFIVGSYQFHSFDSVVKNKMQFRGSNLIQKLDDLLKKPVDIMKYTI